MRQRISSAARQLIGETAWSRFRAWRFGARWVRSQCGGRTYEVYIADWLAREWYGKGMPAAQELEFLAQHALQRGARVFDIGAHQAVVAMMLGDVVGSTGSVIAVELDAHNARVARLNVARNGMKHVEVIEAAAAAKEGSLPLGHRGASIAAVSIDGLTDRFGPPDVLFIDVDGYEVEVLRGASGTLGRCKPDLFVEIHTSCGLESFGGSLDQVLAQLAPHGYDLWSLADKSAHAPSPFRRDDPVTVGRFFLLATRAKGAR